MEQDYEYVDPDRYNWVEEQARRDADDAIGNAKANRHDEFVEKRIRDLERNIRREVEEGASLEDLLERTRTKALVDREVGRPGDPYLYRDVEYYYVLRQFSGKNDSMIGRVGAAISGLTALGVYNLGKAVWIGFGKGDDLSSDNKNPSLMPGGFDWAVRGAFDGVVSPGRGLNSPAPKIDPNKLQIESDVNYDGIKLEQR